MIVKGKTKKGKKIFNFCVTFLKLFLKAFLGSELET